MLSEVLDQRVTALSTAEPAEGEPVGEFLKRTLLYPNDPINATAAFEGFVDLVFPRT